MSTEYGCCAEGDELIMVNQSEACGSSHQTRPSDLQAIFDRTPAVIIVWQMADGSPVEFISASIEKLLGYKAEDFLSGAMSWHSVIHPDDLPRLKTQLKDYLDAGIMEFTCEYRMIDKAGKAHSVEDRVGAIQDSDGHVNACQSVLIDVTDRNRVVAALQNNKGSRHSEDVRENSAAEDALWEREENYRALIENSHDVVMRFDDQGRHLYVSPSVADITDMARENFIGKTHREIGFPEELCDLWEQGIRKVLETGEPFETEFEFAGAEGVRYVNWRLFPEGGCDGQVKTVVTVARDITEFRNAEQNYRAIFHEMLDGFALHEIICDAAGKPIDYRFLAVNPAFERLTGLKGADVIGKRVLEILPNTESHWIETYGAVALTGEPAYFENYAQELGRHFEVTSYRPAMGQFACIFVDVTKRFRAEQALKESEAKFRSVVNASPLGMFIYELEEDGRLILVDRNPAADDILKRDCSQLIGTSIEEAFPPLANTGLVERVCLAASEGVAWHADEVNYKDDRIEGLYEVHAFQTSPGQVAVTFFDITERKKAQKEKQKLQERMLHSQKLESMGVLAGGIAHDFNNLLTAILGNAELAARQLPPDSAVRESIDEIQKASNRAADLTNQMLAYSGKGRFLVQLTSVNDLVQEITQLLSVSISKKVSLKYEFAENLPAVEADATQLRQVVMNLITNASEAIGDEVGEIVVSTGLMKADRSYFAKTYMREELPEGQYVYLEVSDTGCGMDKQTKAAIFDPFFTTKFTGRGLGLASVLGIVRSHNGTISVQSAPGEGTKFRVLLPPSSLAAVEARSVESPAVEQAVTNEQAESNAGGSVLVVEDEAGIRNLAKAALESSGFTVFEAEDGREAIEIMARHAGDISAVMLDLTMPHMSGEETFTEIRKLDPQVPIILCSGYSEQDVSSRFAGRDSAGFVQKPYRLGELVSKLQEILR